MNLVFLALTGLVVFFVVRMLWLSRPGITPAAAHAAVQSGDAVLIDVREPAEWSGGVAQSAALLSFSDLRGGSPQWESFLRKNQGKRLILYCASGARSGSAAGELRRRGHNAVNLGGLSRWTAAGLPVRRPN